MRDRRHENSKHESRVTIKYYYSLTLHIFAFESVLQSSFEFFASIHLLVFGSPFVVSQRLGGWVVSERLANKSAWSSSYSPGLIRSYFMSSAIQYISASSESKVISESDEVEDIVTKNRNPSTVES